jgi:hypothetical protein
MQSRRNILATAAAGAVMSAATARAAGFGNPDEPAEDAVNVTNPKALTTRGRRIKTLQTTSLLSSTRRQPTSTACRSFGLHSILLPSVPRTAAGRGRLPRMTSKSRRQSPVSTCGSVQAAFVSCIGTSKRNGRS